MIKSFIGLFLIGVLFALSEIVLAGTGAFPSGGYIKMLKDGLIFKDSQVSIVTGDSDDPTSVAKAGVTGSMYFRDGTAEVYLKQDSGVSTNWELIGQTITTPGTTTDNAIVRWDGIDGTAVLNSGIIIDDLDNITGVNDLAVGGSLSSADLTINSTQTIDTISTDDTLAGDADTTLPTESAVKGYVDAQTADSVQGPGPTVTDESIVVWDGTGGYTVKGTPVTVNGTGDIAGVNDLTATGDIVAGTLTGTVSVDAGNLQLSGNDLVSTDTNGNIALTPNGTGEVVASTLEVSDLTDSRVIVPDGANGLVSTPVIVSPSTGNTSGVGALSVSSITINGSQTINEVSTDDTLAGDADDVVPSESAVKGYADTVAAAEAASAVANRVIGPGPTTTDGQVAVFDGTGGYTIKGVPVSIDASGNVTGVADLTISGVFDNGELNINQDIINFTDNAVSLFSSPEKKIVHSDINGLDKTLGSNNPDLGQFMQYPSFEESGFELIEWTCTNCSVSRVAGGTHGDYSMQITWGGTGCAVFDYDTTSLATTGASSYSRFQVSTEDTGITYGGRVDGSAWSVNQTILPVASIGVNWNDVNTHAFPMGATSTGVEFCGVNNDVLRVDFVEGGGVTRYSGQPTSQVQAEELVIASGNGGQTLTAGVTNIQFVTDEKDPHNMWDGSTFTADQKRIYTFNLAIAATTQDLLLDVYIDDVRQFGLVNEPSSSSPSRSSGSFSIELNAGQTVQFRSAAAVSLSNLPGPEARHKIIIQAISTKQSLTGVCSGGPLKCENDFSARVTAAGAVFMDGEATVAATSSDWITGPCPITNTSDFTCPLNSSLDLTKGMICTTTRVADTTAIANEAKVRTSSTTNFVVKTFDSSDSAAPLDFNIKCVKSKPDRVANGTMRASLEGLHFSTSEIWTGGYDLVSNKEIYKRCFRVASDVTGSSQVLADWNLTTVTPVGLFNYFSDSWLVLQEQNSDGTNLVQIRFDKSDGDILADTSGPSRKVGAGSSFCMEYTYD